jgi:hypothetical protein
MKIKEHMANGHKALSAIAQQYAESSKAHAMMAAEHNADSPEYHFHTGMSESTLQAGETVASCAKALDMALKSLESEDLEKIAPTWSAVAPTASTSELRLVPRDGSGPAIQKAQVPREFARLIAVDEDELEA